MINEEIRAKELRVIDTDGTQLGIISRAEAMELAEENDIVLLLGKGHEMVQKFKDYEIEFDEREVVKSLCN